MIVRTLPGRPMVEVARDLVVSGARRDALIALAENGIAHDGELDELAVLEAERVRFVSLCIGMPGPTLCLMAAGLRWDDELRHPASPGIAARVRLGDRVLIDDVETPIAEASKAAGGAIGDWHGRGIVLGDVFGLRPASAAAAQTDDAASEPEPDQTDEPTHAGDAPPSDPRSEPVPIPTQGSLF